MSDQVVPKQGDIWDVYFDPVVGREQGGRRPSVVLSNTRLNSLPSRLCVVAPLTTRNRDLPLHVPVAPPEGGIKHPSVILCDQIRAVSHDRLRRYRGQVSPETVAQAVAVIGVLLDSDG